MHNNYSELILQLHTRIRTVNKHLKNLIAGGMMAGLGMWI